MIPERRLEDRGIRLGVCVDDFGLSPHVNGAVLELAAAGRISAVSCLVDAPAWRAGAAELARHAAGRVDIGLHLNLTEAFESGHVRFSLPALIARAYAGMLDRRALADAIRAQLDDFESTLGAAPDFVDGHQHVHQLPLVSDALLVELARRRPTRLPWLRRTRPARVASATVLPESGRLKHRLIAALGEDRLARNASRLGFRQNAHLLGVYGFTGSAQDYAARVSSWCRQAEDDDLLMCHPAAGEDRSDSIAAARANEYAVLRSDRFAAALATRGVVVTRLSGCLRNACPGRHDAIEPS